MLPSKLARVAEEAKISRLLFSNHDEILNPEPAELDDDEEQEEEARRRKSKKKFAPVWHDEDDDETEVGKALDSQGRRLPDGGINARSNKYSDLLKHKFETIVGNPRWAQFDRNDETEDDELLQTVGHIEKSKNLAYLKKGLLEFKKVMHLNVNTIEKESIINVVKFHPKASVAMVGGKAGTLSLVTVDGKQNEKLHSVSFKKFSIFCGHFYPDGEKVILGSNQPYCYVYDLMNAKSISVPLPNGMTRMDLFRMSPCGKYLAVAGKFGDIHLLCARSKELIQTLKQNSKVADICFSPDSSKLFAHGEDGNVTIWNMTSLRVSHKWYDEGCVSGSCLAISPSGDFFATGSEQGVVNIYETKDTLNSKEPIPKKAITNLTTKIKGVTFNSQSEMLSLHSSNLPNALRLVNIPSFEVYSNFPMYPVDFGHVSTVEFSPNSGFLSFGTNMQLARLYRLKHYKNY